MRELEKLQQLHSEIKILRKSAEEKFINQKTIHTKAAAASIIEQVKKYRKGSYVLDAQHAQNALTQARIKKSVGGSGSTIASEEIFAQQGRHKDFISDYLTVEYVSDRQSAISIVYNNLRTGVATAVLEADPKPVSEQNISSQILDFIKIAFTDTISDEALRFTETFEDYLVNSAYAHLMERLTDIILFYIFNAGTPFNTASYTGTVPSPTVYDLIHFMLDQYNSSSINATATSMTKKKANLVIIPSRFMTTIRLLKDSNNRYQFQPQPREAYFDVSGVLEYSDLLGPAGNPLPSTFAAVLNSRDIKIYVHRDIEVYMDRVYDDAQDRNMYRLTAEMYVLPIAYRRNGTQIFPVRSNIPTDLSAL